jgi:hypothetical protein
MLTCEVSCSENQVIAQLAKTLVCALAYQVQFLLDAGAHIFIS